MNSRALIHKVNREIEESQLNVFRKELVNRGESREDVMMLSDNDVWDVFSNDIYGEMPQ